MKPNEKDPIKRALPPRRDPVCFELQHAILIPAGTILRQDPGLSGAFTVPVANGVFSVDRESATNLPSTYKRVIA